MAGGMRGDVQQHLAARHARRRAVVGAAVGAHRVDPALHRVFDEQVPRIVGLTPARR